MGQSPWSHSAECEISKTAAGSKKITPHPNEVVLLKAQREKDGRKAENGKQKTEKAGESNNSPAFVLSY